MKYRKKPVVIDAFEWTGDINQKEDPEWLFESERKVEFINDGTKNVRMLIHTLEGVMAANLGDYIIKGVEGEIYPCKPNIFKATYEKL